MQDYKTRSRSDRRDDARRAPATAHTPYRPRTHRKGFSQNLDRAQAEESLEQRLGNERRSERPRQGAASQEGRYRPRTARNFSDKDASNIKEAPLPETSAGETEATNDNRFSPEERFDDRKPRRADRRNDRREEREERFDNRKPRRDDRRNDDRRENRDERFDNRRPRRDDRRNDWREDRDERFDNRKPRRDDRRENRDERFDNRRPRRDDRRNDWREDRDERFDNRKSRRDDRRNDWREDREVRFDDRKPRRNDRRENRDERFDNRKPRRDDRRNDRRDDRSPFAAKQRRRDEKEQKSYFEGLNQFLGEESSRNNRRGDRSEDRDRRNVRREDRSSLKPPVRREDRAQTEQREHPLIDLSQPMRLNRYIAHCGACSRRDADEMITSGEIAINGTTCTTLGEKIIPNQDVVTRNGETLTLEQKVYILLNKPKDYICTVEDPHAEHTVLDLVKDACAERIYPVGRLDRNTTGLLLLTNDGELTDRLTHPSYAKQKTYEVTLDRKVTAHDMEQLLQGVTLDDGETAQVDEIAYVRPNDSSTVGVTIHTGQNRVVRRMFDSLGFRVERLDRVLYAGLTKRNLPRGTWRYLTPEEVRMLKNDSYK